MNTFSTSCRRTIEALNDIMGDPVKKKMFETCLFAIEGVDSSKVEEFRRNNIIDIEEDCAPMRHSILIESSSISLDVKLVNGKKISESLVDQSLF